MRYRNCPTHLLDYSEKFIERLFEQIYLKHSQNANMYMSNGITLLQGGKNMVSSRLGYATPKSSESN